MKLGLVAGIACLYFFPAKAFDIRSVYEHPPHASVPFSVSEPDRAAHLNFVAGGNLKRTYKYTFYLSFHIEDAPAGKMEEIRALLGSKDQLDGATSGEAGNFFHYRTGAQLPLRLTICKMVDTRCVPYYDETVHQLWTLSSSKAYDKVIDTIELPPADYLVTLRSLAAMESLNSTPVTFEIGLPGKH